MKISLALVAAILAFAVADARAANIDYEKKTINLKIVYWGTGPLDDNLAHIYKTTNPENRGQIVTLDGENGKRPRDEYYSYLPVRLGEVRGFRVHLDLYTVPTGRDFRGARELILAGVDGIVFVAAAGKNQEAANVASLAELESSLQTYGFAIDKLPLVFQVTGGNAKTRERVKKSLATGDRELFAANPKKGTGVFDTLKAITKLVLTELRNTANGKP